MSSNEENNFWVSYSDLATGLMIVFMLVMLIMVMIQKKATEAQTETISEITSTLEIILGEKSKLADSINVAFKEDPTVQADPVTAQISIDEDALKFAENQAMLQPKSLAFIKAFTPRYLCALWSHEQMKCARNNQKCPRLDPENPGGVRRIHITGHADMKGLYADNHLLSAKRAEEVVQQMLASLESTNPTLLNLPAACQTEVDALRTYAEERLWSSGAGETQHCTSKFNASALDDYKGCDGLLGSDKEYRKVDFRLEVTGDDMTGLLADVVELRNTVGLQQDESSERINKLAETVVNTCWKTPKSYHGCQVFAKDCLEDKSKPNCQTMFDNKETDLGVYNLIKKICRDTPSLKHCEK